MKLDILGELTNALSKIEELASEYWQVCIIDVVAIFRYIIYALLIK